MNEKEDVRSLFKLRLKNEEEVTIRTKIMKHESFVLATRKEIINFIEIELKNCISFYAGSLDIDEFIKKNSHKFKRYTIGEKPEINEIKGNSLLDFGSAMDRNITIMSFFLKEDKKDKILFDIKYKSSSMINNYYVETFVINRHYLKYNVNEDTN